MKVMLMSPGMFVRDGGIERSMRLLLKALCAIYGKAVGRCVDSVCLADQGAPPTSVLARYANHTLGEYRTFSHRRLRFTLHVLRRARQTDLIVCGHINQLVVARLAQLLNPRLRYCLIGHGFEMWRPFTPVEHWALRGANKILCVSEFTKRKTHYFCPKLSNSQLSTIFWILDPYLEKLQSPPPLNGHKEPSNPVILSVGRVSLVDAYKGFDTLIQAMPEVLRSYPSAQLRIIGTGDDLARLHTLAAQMGVSDAVRFVGRVSDEVLAKEYDSCSVFALPSRDEGFGIVYLEAMSRGKSCIAARAGAAPEIVIPSTGLCVDYANVQELAAAITELVRAPRDPKLVRQHAESFSYERFCQRLAEVLPR